MLLFAAVTNKRAGLPTKWNGHETLFMAGRG